MPRKLTKDERTELIPENADTTHIIWTSFSQMGEWTLLSDAVGDIKCDTCDNPVAYADASIPAHRGSWANVCRACFERFRCTLGVGRGQVLLSKDDPQVILHTQWLATIKAKEEELDAADQNGI
jgi:hypothetical protein